MARLSDILTLKGHTVVTIAPEATVHEAVRRMVEHSVGSLLVVEDEHIVGIFTERDYLRRVALPGVPPTARVRDLMTTQLIVASPHDLVLDCMAIMSQRRIRHVPVLDNDRLLGMVSIGDLVQHVSREQEVEIQYLREFIGGSL
jgi:CBS domain-containing protein